MKKVAILLLLALFVYSASFAQQKLIQFDGEAHAFGEIKEDGGPVKHVFNFTNTSAFPVKLSYVKASCGCTTPTYTQDVIPVGGKGNVSAQYDPMNRPGNFDKGVTVKAAKVDAKGAIDSSVAESVFYLRITGNVIPRQKGPADWYPVSLGSLRLSSNQIPYGDVFTSDVKEATVTLYNSGESPLTFKDIKLPPGDIISVNMQPGFVLNPSDSFKLVGKVDFSKVNDWGFIHNNFTLVTDEATGAEKLIYITANVKEYFKPEKLQSLKDKVLQPSIAFDKITHNFGNITQGETVSTKFVITNNGKKPLKLHKTKTSCGCTLSKPAKDLLEPGESTEMEVSYNSTGKPAGNDTKTVTVISNDPKQPSVTLTISGVITLPTGQK